MRFRTVVKWTGSEATGWLSATNAASGGDIVINALTSAVALELALDSNLSLNLAIGKVDAGANALKASPAFPGHSDAEISALAQDLGNFLTNDIDPVGAVGAIKPILSSLSSGNGFPGSLVTITGNGFLPVAGGNTVKFGTTAAPIYLATTTKLIVGVPAGAATGNVTVTTTRGGQSNGLPFNVTAGVSILIKTNGILAPYYVSGAETVPQPGNRNVTVYPGTSQVVFSTGQAATFVVAADGTVDGSLSNGALSGLPGEINFQTTTLNVNPNGYAGNYVLGGGFMASSITGNGSANVLKGLNAYQLVAGAVHLFDVDSGGTVTPRLSWATGGSGTLTFSNTNLTVQANGYVGNWSINGVTASAQTGTVVISVPKDSNGYVFNVLGTAFTFDVSGTNVVSTTSSYATGGTNLLSLNMVSVQVDTKGFTGMWSIGSVTNGWVRDTQTVTMMKNFNYRISFWPGNSYVAFGVGGNGDLTIQSAGGQATTGVVTASSGKLTFSTEEVVINSGGWKGFYGLLYGSTPGTWTWLQTSAGDANWVIGGRGRIYLRDRTWAAYEDALSRLPGSRQPEPDLDRHLPEYLKYLEQARQAHLQGREGLDLGDLVDLYHALENALFHRAGLTVATDLRVIRVFTEVTEALVATGIDPAGPEGTLLFAFDNLAGAAGTRFLVALAARIRSDPALRAGFTGESEDVLVRLVEDPALEPIREGLEAYLGTYGHRGPGEMLLERQMPIDRPDLVVAQLQALVAAPAPPGIARPQVPPQVERALEEARDWIGWRERMRAGRAGIFDAGRRCLAEIGARLAVLGVLGAAGDIWFLSVEEALDYCEGYALQEDLAALVALRRQEFSTWRADPPPEALCSDSPASRPASRRVPEPADETEKGIPPAGAGDARSRTVGASGAGSRILRGVVAWPGRIEGVARVLRDPGDTGGLAGGILVADRTDPGWTPLFPTASAIVVEHGNPLCHAAILARELKIPTLVGVRGLLAAVKDGDRILVDATAGEIRLLAPTASSAE